MLFLSGEDRDNLYDAAQDLLPEQAGDNPEYERAISELVCDLTGTPQIASVAVLDMLRARRAIDRARHDR